MTTVTVRQSGRWRVLVVAAAALLLAASQAQWWMLRWAELLSLTPQQVEWVWAVLALVGLVACRDLVRQFPVPAPPRPSYDRTGRAGVAGWGLVGVVMVAPLAGGVVRLLGAPAREPVRYVDQGVGELLLDGVLVPALWEEFVWRVVVLAVLLRVTGPRLAVVLQAVSFAVAHTSWSVGFGRVAHSVVPEYLVDLAVEVAISGLVFGFLVLELGTVWPAVVVHAIGNVSPVFRAEVPWLSFVASWLALSYGLGALVLMRRQAVLRIGAWLRRPQFGAVLRRVAAGLRRP